MRNISFTLLFLAVCSGLYAQEVTYREVCDVPYSDSEDSYAQERCKLDVYYSKNLRECPVVVWLHGGGLTSGNKFVPDKLKNSDMVVVAVNYRLLPKVEIDACIDDAAAAVAWTMR